MWVRLDVDDWQWLVRTVGNTVAKARDNPSVYCDYTAQYERIAAALAAATTAAPEARQVAAATGLRKPRRKRGQARAALPNLCGQHPTYGAVLPPRRECAICWAAYEKNQGKAAAASARRKYERRTREEP